MVLIDLQKAFDTIDLNILISKMPSLGFPNEMIYWVLVGHNYPVACKCFM